MIRKAAVLLALAAVVAGGPVTTPPDAEARSIRGEYREGMREIARERREMRREIRREIRRRHIGRAVAGVVLGSIVHATIAGRQPPRPSPDLCWFWSGDGRTRGYWYYCDGD